MLGISNKILECYDGLTRSRDLAEIEYIVIHRIDFSEDDGASKWAGVDPIPTEELTGPIMAAKFRDVRQDGTWRDRPGAYTGGECPYTFLIKMDGTIDQCLEVSDTGPHARRWNKRGLGIALAGDFRDESPPQVQFNAAIELSMLLAIALTDDDSSEPVGIVGHDELKGSSKNKKKQCPGRYFEMDALRYSATWRGKTLSGDDAFAQLKELGVRF